MAKTKKVFALNKSQLSIHVVYTFKAVITIVDYLPLKDLVRISRVRFYLSFIER